MAVKNMLRSLVKRASAAVALTQNEIQSVAAGNTLQSIVERAAAAVTLKPALGRGTDRTSVRLRTGTTCEVEEGPWQVVADLEPELGGSHQHPGPGFLLRAALGTCLAQTAALWAAKLEVPIDRLEVEVEADHDARGLLGVDSTAPRFTGFRYRITAESTAPEEDVKRVLDAARAHSPVHDCLEYPLAIDRDVQVVTSPSR